MMAMWNKKGHMGGGDSVQPQDLSISKNKDQQRLESAVRQVCSPPFHKEVDSTVLLYAFLQLFTEVCLVL